VRRALLLLGKDVRVLRRSPALAVLLVVYPIAIAGLVGLVASYANSKPRVALVDEDVLPATIRVGERTFDVSSTIARASGEVTLVSLTREEAERDLGSGRIVAMLVVPRGFVGDLRSMSRSPKLELRTTTGGLSIRVTQQVQALVYQLNRELQDAYIQANIGYIELLRHGGRGTFLGRQIDVLGLEATARLLEGLPAGPRLDPIREFVGTAELALGETGSALRATARPIELVQSRDSGRTWVLSAQVQAYGLALTITLLAVLLAAAALAAERDERVLPRLRLGLAGPGEIVVAKIGLAALVSAALGLGIALAFGVVVEAGGVEGGEPWSRLPLLAGGLALAGAALGALGALVGSLAREARTASLVAILLVLPVIFLGLVPREVAPLAGLASDAFPFGHAVRLFGSALFDLDPWAPLLRESAWLAGLAGLFGLVARSALRRSG
jgi:ABC-2 family transporter protein